MLERQQRRDLVNYRMEKAYKSFEEAKGVARLKYWNHILRRWSSLSKIWNL